MHSGLSLSILARSIQMAHLPCDHMPWGICHVTTCWHVPEHFSAAARLAGACAPCKYDWFYKDSRKCWGMCQHMPQDGWETDSLSPYSGARGSPEFRVLITCWHTLAHAGTCWHMPAHADIAVLTFWHMPAHAGTCQTETCRIPLLL